MTIDLSGKEAAVQRGSRKHGNPVSEPRLWPLVQARVLGALKPSLSFSVSHAGAIWLEEGTAKLCQSRNKSSNGGNT